MKKALFGIILALFMVLAAVPLIPGERAYADVFTDLGFTTSGEDLQNFEERSQHQPYGSNVISINPVPESYILHVITEDLPPNEQTAFVKDKMYLRRSVYGDNNGVPDDNLVNQYYSEKTAADVRYVQTTAVDAVGAGKKHAVVEMYYREETTVPAGATTPRTTSRLYLALVDVATQFEEFPDFSGGTGGLVPIEILSQSYDWFANEKKALITDYASQHTYMSMTAGDFDNDGCSEIAVYIPEAGNPHIALYQIENGTIINEPEVFSLGNEAEPSTYLSMTVGDLTGDNIEELVVTYKGAVKVFKGQDGSFSLAEEPDAVDYSTEIQNVAVAIGDLKNDGHNYLVIGGFTDPGENDPFYEPTNEPYAKCWYINGETLENITGEGIEIDNQGDRNASDLPTLECARLSAGEPGDYHIGYEAIDGDWIWFDGYVWKPMGGGSYAYPSASYVDTRSLQGKITGVTAGNFDESSYGQETFRVIVDGGVDSEISSYQVSLAPGNLLSTNYKVAGNFYSNDWYAKGTTCAAAAAPNMDDDTIIIKYVGYDLQYSYPTILAALASPPYFSDLGYLEGGDSYIGCSSTEITSGEGSSSETHGNVTVTAGAYISLEQEVTAIFNWTKAEASAEITASYAWDYSHEKEVTKAITYGTIGGQDSVAIYTVPVDVYMYEMWVPGTGGVGGSWQTMNHCFPYPAAYVVIPAEKYNLIASRESGLPQIGGELFTHTLGRPETYPTSSDTMFNIKDPVQNDLFMTVGYGNAYTAQNIEITETTTNSHTFSACLSLRAGGGVTGVTKGIIVEVGGGGGWATTTIKDVGYTGTIMNMPLEAEDYGYNYAYNLVAYPYESDSQNFPVVYYAVQDVRRPPLLPQNFEMQSSTENSITLTWDNVDPNVTGYQLYRYYDFEGDLAGYYKVGDIPAGTNSFTDTNLQPYTSYTYRIQSIGIPYGGGQSASVLGPEYVARTNPVSDAPIIVQQPESLHVAAGSNAVFQVSAQPAANASIFDRIFYRWQRYVNGKWQLMEDGSDNVFRIIGVKEQDAGRYRCAVSQYIGSDPVTIYSDVVTLTVDKNNLNLILSFNPETTVGDIGTRLTLEAGLTNTDMVVSPTGKVDFLITYYPEPIITESGGVTQINYPDSVFSTRETPVVAETTAQVDWTPPGYGSYDIVAVYLGDDNYYKSTSATGSFTCANSTSADSGLRITGIENNTLTYGDEQVLGATVYRNGQLASLWADEVEFFTSDPEGLVAEKTAGDNPAWQLTARKAGSYTLTARTTGTPNLQVTKNIVVNKAQISVAVQDQVVFLGNELDPFKLILTAGELKFQDSLEDTDINTGTGTFIVEYGCDANIHSAGVYNIFINAIRERNTSNYEIISTENGSITVEGPKYNVKFHGVSNGTVTALIDGWNLKDQNFTTGYDIAQGANIRFTAIPNSGYRVEKWVVNGVPKMDSSQYSTIQSLKADISIEVYFIPDLCTVTYSAGNNGVLEARVGDVLIGSGASLPARTVASFLATPDEGYMVDEWIVNNAVMTGYAGNSYNQTLTEDTDIQVSFTPAEYAAVSYLATGNGRITAETSDESSEVTNGSLVVKGSDVVFTATPADANSMVKEWVVNGQVVQGSSTVYTAENIQEAINVEVIFMDAITYTVNFGALGYGAEALTAEVDGMVIHSGDQVRGYSDITFTALPPDGYGVKQWKRGSAVIQDEFGSPVTSTTYTLEEIKSSVTVTVEFESTNTYRVDYSVVDTLPDEDGGENGSLSARVSYGGISTDYSSGDDIVPGSRVDLIAVPDSGYRVKDWTINEQTVTDSVYGVYTIDPVDMDFDVTVEFEEGANPLTYAAVGNGTMDGDVPSGTEVDDGTAVSFTAVPDQGYQIKEWRYNGDVVEGSTDCTITVYNGGYVEVEFEREYYTLTLGENLSASVDGIDLQGDSVQVQGDKTVIVSAVPPAGYLLTSWYMDEVLLEEEQGDSLTFTMEQDTEVIADFEQQYYAVTFSAGVNGTLTAAADEVEFASGLDQPGGSRLVFTAQPDEGYRVQDWYSGQQALGSRDETYIIDGLSKPEYIRVYFEVIQDVPDVEQYIVYFSAGNGGSISAAADGTGFSSGAVITAGSRVVFTAQPDSGKTVDSWSGVDNGTVSDNKLTFTIDSLASNESVSVTFKDTTTNSSPAGGGGGGLPASKPVNSTTGSASVKPSAGGTISLGTEASITIPAGALQGSDTQRLKITRVESPAAAPSGFMVLGQVYEFQVDGASRYTFDEPVTLTFTFDPDQVPEGVTPSIYYYDSSQGRWINLGGTVSGSTISVKVNHFTKFAVLAKQAMIIPPTNPSVFSDINSHWAKETIESLAGQKIASGYPDGTFRPNQTITRAEFATLLVKALKLQNMGNGRIFSDTSGHWAKDSIAMAASCGIVSGYDENHFGPDDLITREQMAVMAAKAAKLSAASEETGFIDHALISAWARSDVAAAVNNGFMNGYPDHSFKPQGNATRSEAITVIFNLIN